MTRVRADGGAAVRLMWGAPQLRRASRDGRQRKFSTSTSSEVVDLVDHAHAPAAEHLEDAVVGDRLCDDDGAASSSNPLVEGARAAHERFAGDPRHRGDGTEEEVDRLGYDLLARHRPDDAVRVLRLNVGRYPESSNAHDSLGEALAAAGETEGALASYRESLRLDPSNDNARRMIDQLEAPPSPERGPTPGSSGPWDLR